MNWICTLIKLSSKISQLFCAFLLSGTVSPMILPNRLLKGLQASLLMSKFVILLFCLTPPRNLNFTVSWLTQQRLLFYLYHLNQVFLVCGYQAQQKNLPHSLHWFPASLICLTYIPKSSWIASTQSYCPSSRYYGC